MTLKMIMMTRRRHPFNFFWLCRSVFFLWAHRPTQSKSNRRLQSIYCVCNFSPSRLVCNLFVPSQQILKYLMLLSLVVVIYAHSSFLSLNHASRCHILNCRLVSPIKSLHELQPHTSPFARVANFNVTTSLTLWSFLHWKKCCTDWIAGDGWIFKKCNLHSTSFMISNFFACFAEDLLVFIPARNALLQIFYLLNAAEFLSPIHPPAGWSTSWLATLVYTARQLKSIFIEPCTTLTTATTV